MASADNELESLIDCLFHHRVESLKALLHQAGLSKSGTKEILRDKIRDFLSKNPRNVLAATEYLNTIEGWGSQHVYLFESPRALTVKWLDQKFQETIFKNNRVVGLVNRPRPVILPEKPTLSSISVINDRIRFIWNEKREWLEREEDADTESESSDLVYKAWLRKTARGTTSFDWNLKTGEAMIMIQKLQRGTQYSPILEEIKNRLRPFVDLDGFAVTKINHAISNILESKEARERKTNWETIRGGKVSLSSSGKGKSVTSDQTLKDMKDAGKAGLQGSLGNMYWVVGGGNPLTEEMHTVIHKKDQRIAIMGEKREEEVLHVIGRIRAHSK